jgi:hypothetical protein
MKINQSLNESIIYVQYLFNLAIIDLFKYTYIRGKKADAVESSYANPGIRGRLFLGTVSF